MKRLILTLIAVLFLLAPVASTQDVKAATVTVAFDCMSDCDWYAGGVATGCALAGGDPWICFIAGELAGCQCRGRCDASQPACGSRAFMQAAWLRFQAQQAQHARLDK